MNGKRPSLGSSEDEKQALAAARRCFSKVHVAVSISIWDQFGIDLGSSKSIQKVIQKWVRFKKVFWEVLEAP